jgi:hypothetical protein
LSEVRLFWDDNFFVEFGSIDYVSTATADDDDIDNVEDFF